MCQPDNAWDFCDENDRLKVLKMLKSNESKAIKMEIWFLKDSHK